MRRFFTLTVFILFSIHVQAQISSNLLDPHVWLRADANSLSTTSWHDVSGYDNHAIVLAEEESPTDNGSLNFHKALVFDGINDYIKIPYSLEGLSEITLIAVFQSADTTERGVWGTENAELRKTLLTTRRAKGPEDESDLYGTHEHTAVINTIAQNWTKTAVGGTLAADAYLALGSSGRELEYKPFKGSVAEVMIFNKVLSFLERAQVETYLAIKYGLPLHVSNYVSSKENLLWHTENNGAYATRITGIGRDDAFGLNQKQSKSAHDNPNAEQPFLSMSAGSLANSNDENSATINDQDFLIWGDNNLPLTTRASEGTDTLLSFVERKWMLQASGITANQLPTELRINLAQLPFSTFGYWLVIDRSGTGNFDRDNLEYVRASYVTKEKIAVFNNLKWDVDGSGKDMFGLAVAKNFYALVRTLANPLCDKRDGGQIAIEVLGGKAPYRYELKNAKQNYSKSWQGSSLREELSNLGAGDYTLTIRNADNEKVVRNFTLTWPDALHIDLGADQKLVENQVVTLDASTHIPSSTPVTYRWESNNGFTSSEPKVEVDTHGLYKVSVTNAKGCVFTDEIALSGEEHRFEVFPTVVHDDKFSIGISLQEPGAVNVKITNSSGRVLQEINGSDSSEYLFTGYAKDPGMYLVVLQTPKGIESKKVIVY